MADILVVDDDHSIVTTFQRFLAHERHLARTASNAHDALRLISERTPDLVIMDVHMPGMDGLQALNEIRARHPHLTVVIMTAYGTSQVSIDAIRAGAFDFLTKPFTLDELRSVIGKALAARRVTPTSESAAIGSATEVLVNLVGQTPVMLEVYKIIAKLANNEVPALISGERGTGKQLVAETIHDNSARRDEPFAAIDCGTLNDAVIAEIFDGDAGTILLVDIEAMPAPLQGRLARALGGQGRSAPGGARLTARVLASTTRDLAEDVRQGAFNRELFSTLSVITIHLPPLRERRSDIPRLVGHLIQRFNAELHRSIQGVDDSVATLFNEHPWSGNVRELQTVVKRACILARGEVISADDLGQSLTGTHPSARLPEDVDLRTAIKKALHDRLHALSPSATSSAFHDIVDTVEETLVQEALTMTNGNQVKASEMLGVNRATLRKKMP
jgi:two-component system response regulator AtoC